MVAFFSFALGIGRKEGKEIKVSHQANLIEMLFSTKGLTKHLSKNSSYDRKVGSVIIA